MSTTYFPPSGPSRNGGEEVTMGHSVRYRASQFEQAVQGSSSSRLAPMSSPLARTRSTSPPRLDPRYQSPYTSPCNRHPSIPSTATSRAAPNGHGSPMQIPPSRRLTPPQLRRGPGSARKMIQQWETIPISPTGQPRTLSYNINREYLDQKPLPFRSPNRATSTPFASPGRHPSSPSRNYNLSPLHHLQTPQRPVSMSGSPSSWSLSPDKRKKGPGKSPLKDMLNVFGGGGFGKKAKGKGKEKFRRDLHMEMHGGPGRMGSNGLPGGIVFRDRMGDQEMDGRESGDPNIIRTSAILYLVPTPCSSVSPWGTWLTSYATLTKTALKVIYRPVFQDAQTDHSTDKRVFSGANRRPSNEPAVPFSSISPPDPDAVTDVDLSMKDCVEVRSLRREEVRGRRVPTIPEGFGTEVLEMVWSDGSKRYIGVEGVAGRLGWVSAIWDVLLACKSNIPPALPPPSPVGTPKPPTPAPQSPFTMQLTPTAAPYGATLAPPTESNYDCRARADSRGVSPGNSSAPPVQKIGDRWVAASVLGAPSALNGSVLGANKKDLSADALRDSVKRMFDAGPDLDKESAVAPTRRETETERRVVGWENRRESDSSKSLQDWEPKSERDLSIFGRSSGNLCRSDSTPRSPATISIPNIPRAPSPLPEPTPEPVFEVELAPPPGVELSPRKLTVSNLGRHDIESGNRRADSVLSFDPNDLNPSRSASQVRRRRSERKRKAPVSDLEVLEEGSDDEGATQFPAEYVSHVAFPKAKVGGLPLAPKSAVTKVDEDMNTIVSPAKPDKLDKFKARPALAKFGPLEVIPSAGSSSVETGESGILKTPDTAPRMLVLPSADDHPTMMSKLDAHIAGHGVLADQIGGVQVDLRSIITSLTSMVTGSRMLTSEEELYIPKGLDNKLNTLQLDVKAIENALTLSSLSAVRLEAQTPGGKPKVVDVYAKLDTIAKMCEQVLSKSDSTTWEMKNERASKSKAKTSLAPHDELTAADEATQIMAQLTGGSNQASPRHGGLQVLHNISNPSSPRSSAPSTPLPPPISEETKKQVGEVLTLVKDLKEARSLQTQQTTDIARYLNELNTWLEKFVQNSTTEITSISKRLSTIVPDPPFGDNKDATPGMPDLVADMHSMVTEQKKKAEAEGAVGARLDQLLQMMGQEQDRQAGQTGMVEQVLGILDRQRSDNELLLRALATDLTTEIRGERLRFVEAMQQATTMNISMHVEEFKKLLSAEVHKSMKELGTLREERKALEHQISDLFALKAKFGGADSRRGSISVTPRSAPAPQPTTAYRILPAPPGRPR